MSQWMFLFFFFNDTATTEIYTLSLHDALPIFVERIGRALNRFKTLGRFLPKSLLGEAIDYARGQWSALQVYLGDRSEEHTSELQSLAYIVCRLLLEKKK